MTTWSSGFIVMGFQNKSLTTSSVPELALRSQSTAAFCCQATERALTQGFDTVIQSCKSIIGCWLTLIKPLLRLSMSAISMITAAKAMATATITGFCYAESSDYPSEWKLRNRKLEHVLPLFLGKRNAIKAIASFYRLFHDNIQQIASPLIRTPSLT
jgi:hypothetical protein